jgi:hypothetical protein
MALSSEEAAKLANKLQEIERLSRSLGANINTLNLQPLEQNAGAIEALFESLTAKAKDLGGDTEYLVSNFRKLSDEIKNSNTTIGSVTKSLKTLGGISEQILQYQRGYNDLSSKEIGKLKDKVQAERDRLHLSAQLLEDEAYSLTLQKNSVGFQSLSAKEQQSILDKLTQTKLTQESINNLLQNEDVTLIELNNRLKESEDKAKHIEKTLGATGVILEGMSKIPIIGGLVNAENVLKKVKKQITENTTQAEAMKLVFKEVAEQIKEGLNDPLVKTTIALGLLKKGFNIVKDLFTAIDESTGKLAKGMNMSYANAAALKGELASVAKSVDSSFVNSTSLGETLVAIGQTLGSNAKLNKEDAITFTELRTQAGYTNEELASIQRLTLATGGNLKDNVKTFSGTIKAVAAQNKLIINEKQLLQEISKVSDAIKLSIGANPAKLAEAAVKAKQFGINLEQADRIAESLLDFESSIENEISAELITGKQINLEKARLLALNGDIAGASAEILQQVGGTAEFSKMNRIQQEAIAKATGMTREDLAKSLVEREALAKLSGVEGANAQERYNKLRETMSAEEAAKVLGDESLAQQLEQTSVAEKYQSIVQKIQDAFVPIAEKLLPKISAAFEWLGKHTSMIAGVLTGIGTIIGVFIVKSLASAVVQATRLAVQFAAAAAAWAIANPVQALVGLGVAATIGTMFALSDGMIDPNGGLVVSKPEGGVVAQGIKNDNVVFTTNKLNSGGGGSANVDMSPVVVELQNVRSILNQILTKEGSVEMDSTKVGTSTNIGTYKVQ